MLLYNICCGAKPVSLGKLARGQSLTLALYYYLYNFACSRNNNVTVCSHTALPSWVVKLMFKLA